MPAASADPTTTRQWHGHLKHQEHLKEQERDRKGRRDRRIKEKRAKREGVTNA
jgi:hypothetical protein